MSKEAVVVTGGTGLIGRRLCTLLGENGADVRILTRSPRGRAGHYFWNPSALQMDPSALEGTGVIFHLAGENIGDKHWSPERKEAIIQSRRDAALTIFENVRKAPVRPRVFVAASAVGWYGNRGEESLTENSGPGTGFLADTTMRWEKDLKKAENLGMRTVILRVGVVFARDGGALPKMASPIRFFVGSPLGNGRQYTSWIHLDDLCRMFVHAWKQGWQGTYNATAPSPATNAEVTRAIADALRRPLFFPALPGFVLKMILGEMASLVLDGARVVPERALHAGFQYTFPDLAGALKDILG